MRGFSDFVDGNDRVPDVPPVVRKVTIAYRDANGQRVEKSGEITDLERKKDVAGNNRPEWRLRFEPNDGGDVLLIDVGPGHEFVFDMARNDRGIIESITLDA